jgi:predicted porin
MAIVDRIWDISGSRMNGAHLDYLSGPWQWRLGYAQIRFKQELPVAELHDALNFFNHFDLSNALKINGKLSRYVSLGGIYDNGPWQVHLMLSRTRQESDIYENGRAGYFLVGHRFGAWTPYLGYSWWKSKPKGLSWGPLPPEVDALVLDAATQGHTDQRTATLGLRWDFRENMALKAQWDRIRGKPTSVFPYRWENVGRWDGNTDVLSLTLDFIF